MTDSRYNSEDYISFENIKSFFYQIIRGFFSIFDYFLGLLKSYWMLFALLAIIGTGIGYLLKSVVTYNSDLTMLVKFNDLTPSTYSEIINSINDLAKSKAYERLATELDIKTDAAQQISEVSLEMPGKEILAPEDTSVRRSPFLIIVSLRSIAVADEIQSAIIGYINNNPYIKRLKDGQLTYYQDELTFINNELRKLDSLKREYTQSLNSGKNATIYYNAFNPADIYARSAGLMQQKEGVVLWLATEQNAASLISGVKQEKIAVKRSFKLVIWGLLLGVLLSFLIAVWQELRTKTGQERQHRSSPSEGK